MPPLYLFVRFIKKYLVHHVNLNGICLHRKISFIFLSCFSATTVRILIFHLLEFHFIANPVIEIEQKKAIIFSRDVLSITLVKLKCVNYPRILRRSLSLSYCTLYTCLLSRRLCLCTDSTH